LIFKNFILLKINHFNCAEYVILMIEHYTWADKIAAELRQRHVKKHVVHGMWTPSGYFHIGNARAELLMPGLAYQAIRDAGLPAEFNLFVDDIDDLDKIPAGISVDRREFEQYLGRPMYEVPSPVSGFKSWSDFFTAEIREVMHEYGLQPEWYSSYENYKRGIYDQAIRVVLNNARKTRDILVKITGAQKPENWIPIMIICENCGRSGTTVATGWDGSRLSYSCTQGREYAQGCKYSGELVPEKGNVKLPWRVHWPATWFIFGTTFESGGKDHFAAGGSVESGRAICKEIFRHEPPLQIGVEFIQIDSKKISGSKGNLISLKQWLSFAEPELLRFLYISYQPGTVINIDVRSQKFFLLTDRYDESERAYYGSSSITEKRTAQLKRIYEISQVRAPEKEQPLQVPFSTLVMLAQVIPDVSAKKVASMLHRMGTIKKEKLTAADETRLDRRLRLAKNWIERYAPDMRIKLNAAAPIDVVSRLTKNEKTALAELNRELGKIDDEEKLQSKIYDIARAHSIEPKKFFRTIYNLLLNNDEGPKLAPFILAAGKEKVIKLLEESV
jgi:lysyl-tRNA synthetase class 1